MSSSEYNFSSLVKTRRFFPSPGGKLNSKTARTNIKRGADLEFFVTSCIGISIGMASGAGKSAAFLFLIINLILYLVVIILASWDVNHALEKTHETASVLTIPARIFPIYFPKGNMATGFFVIFSLIAGVVGFINSVTGIYNVMAWNPSSLHAAAASSFATWTLTLLSMGLACKEINIGYADSNLRTLEIIVILLSGSQLICSGVIHTGVEDIEFEKAYSGRV